MTYSNKTIKAMQDGIWDEFTDPDAAGVKMEDILTGARDIMGVKLTDAQIQSVVEHYNYADDWTDQDEKVRDMIADATDSEDGDKLFNWMVWIDGDQAADGFIDYYENN